MDNTNLPKTILVIEDDKSISFMYKFKLEQKGYRVICAYNGQEGVKKAEEYRPDLALIDIMMPVLSGDLALKEIRSTDWGKNIKALILTNIGKDEAPAILRFLDISGYIVKAHYTPTQVVEIIDKLLI